MGLVDWLRGKGRKAKPEADPLAAFDRQLDSLSARAAELRRAVATLLASRAEIDRACAECRKLAAEADKRLEAAVAGDLISEVGVLERDRSTARGREAELSAELSRLEEEAKAFADLIADLEREAEALRRERATAAARLTAARTLSAAQRAAGERVGERIALDQARDEVERARALAELCGEDCRKAGKR